MKIDYNYIIDFLSKKISSHSNTPLASLSSDVSMENIGLSSLDVVIISGEIEDEFDVEIEPSVIFESKTINDVAHKLLKLINE
ncbi:acyl carrier protein [uncultured Arcticibacterium sp.]|uniref:acyl carrier protein n=1 Tax=uncultured Arcticibacterium sp. TaxID=2173042 RepID=UPI0030F91C64